MVLSVCMTFAVARERGEEERAIYRWVRFLDHLPLFWVPKLVYSCSVRVQNFFLYIKRLWNHCGTVDSFHSVIAPIFFFI